MEAAFSEHVNTPVLAATTALAPAPPNPTPGYFLFNVFDDPSEHHNRYDANSLVVARLKGLMNDYLQDYQDPQDNSFHVAALPRLHNHVWHPFDPILDDPILGQTIERNALKATSK